MLSHTSIEERLRSREIVLRYYFLPNENNSVQFHSEGVTVDLDDSTAEATRFFRSRLNSDRLSLTLGPVVKSHNHWLLTGRPKFRGRNGYFDIRETADALVIAPHETVSIATNERLALGPNTVALIFLRAPGISEAVAYSI
jgi:deoxycytidine triphosphate deaminase